MAGRLAVVVDGVSLPEAEARAFWERFSAHMESSKGDLAGFAKAEGLASVHPEMRSGEPVLIASRSAPQRPYAPAPERGVGAKGGPSRPKNAGRPQGGRPGKPPPGKKAGKGPPKR